MKPSTKQGLFLEDTGDGLRLVVLFDKGSTCGELIIPLTLLKASKLAHRLQDAIARRHAQHATRLPVRIVGHTHA